MAEHLWHPLVDLVHKTDLHRQRGGRTAGHDVDPQQGVRPDQRFGLPDPSAGRGADRHEDHGSLLLQGERGQQGLAAQLGQGKVGDVWNTSDTGKNYAWSGTDWDDLGGSFTVEALTNGEIDTICS